MGPKNGINLDEVEYFELEDYIDKIKLSGEVLSHADETGEAFDKYIKFLSQYPEQIILRNLIDSFEREVKYSNQIERHIIHPREISEKNAFFDSLSINNQRIKDLHSFATEGVGEKDYRSNDVNVGYIENGVQHIYWRGAQPKDIQRFMNAFIKVYKEKGLSQLDSNPFLKAALMSLLFVRIHPFRDGNGRTSRLIYDMKFTEMVNKIYGTNLKIAPLHLSNSLYNNQYTYNNTINNIFFDMEHDCNAEINKWFNFLLYMTDEQLYFMTQSDSRMRIEKLATEKPNFEDEEKITELMRIKKFKTI